MISKKHLLLILATVLLGLACSNQSGNDSSEEQLANQFDDSSSKAVKTKIEGVFQGASNVPVYLQYLKANSIEQLDTVTTDEQGAFEFTFGVEQPGFYRVSISEQNLCVLIVEPGEKIELNADASNIYKTYNVNGSEESQRLQSLNQVLSRRDSISMVLQQAQMEKNQVKFQQAMTEYEQVMAGVSKDVKAFIDEKPGSLSALAATQNLDMTEDFAYYKKVVEALEGKADGNEFYEAIKTQVVQSSKLAIGSEAPEIALPQPSGEELKLSDLRGNYVLIDFWASWCGPCRRENPNVVRVYNKYHEKGFEILGVSLDKNQKAWEAAIQQDGLTWKHVSDLQFWQSSVVPEYQIKGIPLTYLVDPEGKIVAKNLRGPSLEQKLAELFGE